MRLIVLFLVLTAAGWGEDFGSLKAEKIAGDFKFTEGPVWHRDGYLLFSDIPANIIYKWAPGQTKAEVFRQPSGNSNGLAFDRQGRLIACEHSNRRLSRTDASGAVTTLVDRFDGKRLNSPNDVAISRRGIMYFTDPPYGVPKEEKREIETQNVFRLSPSGELSVVATDFDRPNGIALSPDEKILYVADTAKRHVRGFEMASDGTVKKALGVVAEMKIEKGGPDGMKVDRKGNLYVTGPGGIWVFDKKGKHLGTIAVAEVPANCGFGDADGKTLYITARTSLYKVRLVTAGTR